MKEREEDLDMNVKFKCVLFCTDFSSLDMSGSSKSLGFENGILAQEEQSWTNRPVNTSVKCAANRSILKLNCASTKRPAKAAQDRRAPNINSRPTSLSNVWMTPRARLSRPKPPSWKVIFSTGEFIRLLSSMAIPEKWNGRWLGPPASPGVKTSCSRFSLTPKPTMADRRKRATSHGARWMRLYGITPRRARLCGR